MAKKKLFRIGYSVKIYCNVLVEAESEEEALEMYNDGEVETNYENDYQDDDGEEFEYIKPAGDLRKHFITNDSDEDNEEEEE
ncbi:MAG: hypothetical protein IJF84_00255 [Thermoguttaceae bacterium]|nr:hypothetical protein [Thermoguttaceae bacterium]